MRVMVWVVLAAVGARASHPATDNSCAGRILAEAWTAAFPRCTEEYAVFGEPLIGIWAARSALYEQRFDEVIRIAEPLIELPHGADADYLVGSARFYKEQYAAALPHLERAGARHAAAGELKRLARDEQQIAGLYLTIGQPMRAHAAVLKSQEAAKHGDDPSMQSYAAMAVLDILHAVGDRAGAEAAGLQAERLATTPAGVRLARFKRGTMAVERGDWAAAERIFEEFLRAELAGATPRMEYVPAAYWQLAHIKRNLHDTSAALAHAEMAYVFDRVPMVYHALRGVALAESGRLEEGLLALAEAERHAVGEWTWWIPSQAARFASDADAATAASRRAIEAVNRLVADSGTFGAQVMSTHREPYYQLIGLLAARGRWREALDVVARIDAGSMLESRAPPSTIPSIGPPMLEIAGPLQTAATYVPVQAILAAWRGRTLVIVVKGGTRIWRLVLRDGDVDGSDLGDATRLETLADNLMANPDDAVVGRELGEALLHDLPAGPLELLTVGRLWTAPIGALRVGDRYASEAHRIVRATGVLPRTHAPPARDAVPRYVVLGDPSGDLPRSASSARAIARRLGTEPYIGVAATRAAFARARGADLLHVGAHNRLAIDGDGLVLADGLATATEISALDPAPRVVVLAACAASRIIDNSRDNSVARWFLDAGAEYVVATKWTIPDDSTAPFMEAFYEEGGALDPVHALAVAQHTHGGQIPAKTWAAFEVLSPRPTAR